MYQRFYSIAARRERGLVVDARVQLARLTVPQYRNATADLLGQFTPTLARHGGRGGNRTRRRKNVASVSAPEPGLRAQYFQSKGMSKADSLKHERIDDFIAFDFKDQSPAAGITPDQFAVIWEGAFEPAQTGHHEFRIRTENGARLYLNNDPSNRRGKLRDDSSASGQAAFIDGWVSSGEMRNLSARMYLIGGRQYPLRLEFFKYLEKTASIQLEWKPPHGTWSTLDHNHLSTATVPRLFVVNTPFPADDRSLGYERGSSISPEWHSATTNAAIATAIEVVNRLPLLTGINANDADRFQRALQFSVDFAAVAYRRPLTDPEETVIREIMAADKDDPEVAVRRAVLLTLTAPSFLYTDLTPADEAPSQHTIASRLSFALWDSIPDQRLRSAADNGELVTLEQVRDQAFRMIGDPRARAKMQGFFHHWLELEERDLVKDKQQYPEFDEAIIADLRYSLEMFIKHVVWSEESDYRQLLLADYLFLNHRLRQLYQPSQTAESVPTDSADPDESTAATLAATQGSREFFERTSFESTQRAGILTHPYLLSAFAYHNNTSPIHRGVFLTRNIMGRGLKPPPVAVAFEDQEFPPDLTMREKVTLLTRDKACMSCHSIINPLGFALENFDTVGRWRTSENDKPLDTKSSYTTIDGQTYEFQNARDIADHAVASESAQQAFISQLIQYLVKQDPAAYGSATIERLHGQFANDTFNIQNLLAEIAVLAATHAGQAATEQ